MFGKFKRKKQAQAPENLPETGIYYRKSADKYHIGSRIVLLFLAIFIIGMLLAGHEKMKGENFRYLFKAASLAAVSVEQPYSDISYLADKNTKFALYGENLAVIGTGNAALYHPSGECLFRADTGGVTAVDTSGKYMAVYVPGEKSVSFYHSFAKVHVQTYEASVGMAVVAENGTYAVSVTEGSGSSVYVYDSRFRSLYDWNLQNAVIFDMAISSDGKTIAVLTLSFSSGSYYTELTVKNIRTGKTVACEKFDGKKPVYVEFFSDGGFFAALDDELFFYRSSGAKASQVSMTDADSSRYSIDDDAVAVLVSSYRAVVYSSRGDMISEVMLDGRIFDMEYHNGTLYFLSDTAVYLYDTASKISKEYRIDGGTLDFLMLDDGSILLCGDSGIKRLIP